MIGFIIGAVVGGAVGLFFGCACRVAGEADKEGGYENDSED